MSQAEKKYDVLILSARKNIDWEARKAETLFLKSINEGVNYDEISNHPDYLAYASAEFLLNVIPLIIEEMLQRKDTINYLIYPIISIIDSTAYSEFPSYVERAQKIVELADKPFAEKACQFLKAMEQDPPNGPEQVQRLLSFLEEKTGRVELIRNFMG